MNVAFVVNSRSKTARTNTGDFMARHGEQLNVTHCPTTHHGHARLLAEEAVESGSDIIVAVGGDGTINQCVNGMVDTGLPAEQLPVLAIWPAGSGNDFSRTHPCPTTTEDLFDCLNRLETRPVDIGRIESDDSSARHFLNIAEIGIGTTVIQRAERLQRWVGDRLGYQFSIMRTVATCPEFEAEVTGDDFCFRGRFSTIAAANARYYGSGLGVAPDADTTDGLLDIVLLRAFTPFDFIRYLGKLRRCEPINDSRIQVYQSSKLSVAGNSATSLDGELGGQLPVEISVLPSRIRILQFGK